LSYGPNEEGLRYYLENIWPIIVSKDNTLKMVVIGRGGSEALSEFCISHGADYRGEVESTAPYYANALASVVPILSGYGTRIKILESLYYGVPTVSTTKGAEGLSVTSGVNIFLEDEPSEFATRVAEMCALDPHRRMQISQQAQAVVGEKYSEESFRKGVRDALLTADRYGRL
jgi:glycosyltransferase involved in cell wall biosynthesis